MSGSRASRRFLFTAGAVISLLVGGWVVSTILARRFLRYSEVVQATNAICTAAFSTSRSTRLSLEGSLVAQRQVAGANEVIVRELARLERLDWDRHDVRVLRDLQAEAVETGSVLTQPMDARRRDFLLRSLRVGLSRLSSAATHAHAAALQDREQTVRRLYLIHSGTFAAALAAVIVAIVGYTRHQRERDRDERSLQQVNALLRVRADDMEQIVYIASHDLREPLRMVHTYTDLLERNVGPTLNEQGRRFLDQVRKGAKRMQLLVEDLLRLAVVDQHEPPAPDFSASAEVSEVVGMFRTKLDEVGGQLEVGPLPSLGVGRSRFSQLMQNLVGNAIKYREPTRPLRVGIAAQTDGPLWRFVVEDNGIGVASEHREQIFKLFRRLHGPEIEGSGAGLAICKKIVDGWGGRIWVEPRAEHGSRFCFTVPSPTDRRADGRPIST